MALKARYDAKEDRMLLIFEPKEGERRSFWVTRRQWLGLYNGLGPLKPEKPQAKQPPAKLQVLPEALTKDAVTLQSLKLRRKDDAFAISFEAGGQPMGMQVKGEALEQLKQMLDQQADRAGWDAQAAFQRIKAAAAANAAVKKAANKG
ncbi:MAG TPA: hypothetical protein VIE63_11740 [Ramlibacter sp.]|jgi:hypothetical protein